MGFVRKHRRVILLLFSLFALGGMVYGYLRRVGIDPLPEPSPARDSARSGPSAEP